MPCGSGNDHPIIPGLEHGDRRDVAMLRLYHVPNNAIANNLVNQRNPGSDNCPILKNMKCLRQGFIHFVKFDKNNQTVL